MTTVEKVGTFSHYEITLPHEFEEWLLSLPNQQYKCKTMNLGIKYGRISLVGSVDLYHEGVTSLCFYPKAKTNDSRTVIIYMNPLECNPKTESLYLQIPKAFEEATKEWRSYIARVQKMTKEEQEQEKQDKSYWATVEQTNAHGSLTISLSDKIYRWLADQKDKSFKASNGIIICYNEYALPRFDKPNIIYLNSSSSLLRNYENSDYIKSRLDDMEMAFMELKQVVRNTALNNEN